MKETIVLAYSGGLDTSAIIPWLKENYECDVIAYCCDVGNQTDAVALKEKALKMGAKDFIFEDLAEEFTSDFVFPMIRAGATYQQDYLLGTAIARPLMAEKLAKHALNCGATAIAHGATGKGNDQLRFEKAWAYLCPNIKVIAPWRTWDFQSRQDLLDYIHQKGFEFEADVNPKYSVDANLLHCSTEGGVLEDVGLNYDEAEIYQLTATPSKVKTETSTLLFTFNCGIPVAINGEKMPAAAMLTHLNKVGGEHGVGVVDLVEERLNGLKSRGIYETPGGTLLMTAVKNLKQICWNKNMLKMSQGLSQEYGQLIYDGEWFSQSRFALDSFFTTAAQSLTGEVELQLKGANVTVSKRTSPSSLYSSNNVSFETDDLGFYKAASGYMKFATYPSLMAGKTKEVQL